MNEKIKDLKSQFKNYLTKNYPTLKKITIDTYARDAFYVFRHQDEFSIDFFDLFTSEGKINSFVQEIIDQQSGRQNIKKPINSAKAYKSAMLKLLNFFQDKYGNVNNFINS